jgi:hypothetical protein
MNRTQQQQQQHCFMITLPIFYLLLVFATGPYCVYTRHIKYSFVVVVVVDCFRLVVKIYRREHSVVFVASNYYIHS